MKMLPRDRRGRTTDWMAGRVDPRRS